MSIHPKHPKCPECSRSMYKTMTKGRAVSKTDPWAYCRNAKCKLEGVNQSGEVSLDERLQSKGAEETPKAPKAPKAPEADKKVKKKSDKKDKKPPAAKKKAPKKKAGKKKADKKVKSKDKPPKPAIEPVVVQQAAANEEPGTESLPEGLVNGHSEAFQKAALRIQGAIAEDGPFTRNICELALSMATKADGPESAAELVEHYDLTVKFDLVAPVLA